MAISISDNLNSNIFALTNRVRSLNACSNIDKLYGPYKITLTQEVLGTITSQADLDSELDQFINNYNPANLATPTSITELLVADNSIDITADPEKNKTIGRTIGVCKYRFNENEATNRVECIGIDEYWWTKTDAGYKFVKKFQESSNNGPVWGNITDDIVVGN